MLRIWFVFGICFWPGFAVMTLIWFQLWCWHGSTLWFWWAKMWNSWKHLRIISDRITSKSPQTQHRIKTISKPYQNHIKTIQNSNHKKKTQNWPKTCPWAVSISFVEANPLGTLKKVLRSQTMSKPYQHHIQRSTTISKPEPKPYQKTYQYHVEITTPDSKRMKCISEYHINTILNSSKQ